MLEIKKMIVIKTIEKINRYSYLLNDWKMSIRLMLTFYICSIQNLFLWKERYDEKSLYIPDDNKYGNLL